MSEYKDLYFLKYFINHGIIWAVKLGLSTFFIALLKPY